MFSCAVKICGVRTKKEVKILNLLKPNFIGVLVNIPKTTLSVNEETAAKLVKTSKIKTIILTFEKNPKKIVKLVKKIKPWGVQLLRPTKKIVAAIKKNTKAKAIPMVFMNEKDPLKEVKKYPSADLILLDSKKEGLFGGTGTTHNWILSKKIILTTKIPIILAGGLNPKNVKKAIQKTHPFAVDAESGLRNKYFFRDFKKVKKFIKISKN
ncbi:MAG: phosphoribosylanthranilate isomerase [archaeon]|jgi:phosphoribosylanthranilate isomerase